MKRLLIAAISAIALLGASLLSAHAQGTQLCYTVNGSSCAPGVQSSQSVAINIASATTTQLVALSTSKSIFVTHWDVIAGGTGNFTLVYGSGTACGTGTTSLTGAYPLIAQAGISAGTGTGPIILVPKGKALCVTTSTSVQFSGSLSYVQF